MSRDNAHVEDIRLAAARRSSYVEGMARADFLADEKTKAAVAREITIIGEAAARTLEAFRNDHQEIPWDRLIRLRHLYIHVYDRIRYEEVWRTAKRLIPSLESAIIALLPTAEEE